MATDRGIGWELSNRVHFDEIVTGYDKVRPEYPAALLTDVFAYANITTNSKVVEIGAGTGKATRFFLQAGCDVTAIEPGANMSGFLQDAFASFPHFRVVTATFEDAPLAQDSYDLVYAASAFHWVDASIGCPKAFSSLKKGGAIALFRYNIMPAAEDELYAQIQDAYKKHYHKPYVQPVWRSGEDFWQPGEIKRNFGFTDLAQYGFADISKKLYPTTWQLSAEEYIAMLETFSDHRSLPPGDRAALYAGVQEAILRHGGHYRLSCVFQLYMGKKR